MFTRYQGMKLPDNYGGSRFVQSKVEHTQTKTHKPNVYKAVKTTHSPTFDKVRHDNNNTYNSAELPVQDFEDNLAEAQNEQFTQNEQEPKNFSDVKNEQNARDEIYENEAPPQPFSSFPPFYNGTLNSEQYQDENSENESYLEKEFGKQEDIQNSDDSVFEEMVPKGEEKAEKNEILQKNSGFLKLGDLFGKIESDELLLLCIILLISGESKHENSDILPILSLLLLNKK